MDWKEMSLKDRIKAVLGGLLVLVVIAIMCIPAPKLAKMPERETVYFWHQWTGDYAKQAEMICDYFNAYQDKYEVVPLSLPSSANQKLLMSVAGGNPPDIMVQWEAVIPQWADSGLLTPMDEVMSPKDKEFFEKNAFPITNKIARYKGELYAIPTSMGLLGIFYHPEILEANGYKPGEVPQTLEELTELSKKLAVMDKNHNIKTMGFLPGEMPSFLAAWGNGLWDYKTGRLTLNTEGNVKAFEYLVNLREYYGGFDKVAKFEAGLENAGGNGVLMPFFARKILFLHTGAWHIALINQQMKKYAKDYKTMPTPAPVGGNKHYSWLGNCFLVIPKGASNPKGAYEFIKYWSGITDPDEGAKVMKVGGWLPSFRAVRDSEIYQEWLDENPTQRAFVDMMESDNIIYFPPVPYQLYIFDRLNYYYDKCIRGRLKPREALQKLEEDVQEEIARRKKFKLD